MSTGLRHFLLSIWIFSAIGFFSDLLSAFGNCVCFFLLRSLLDFCFVSFFAATFLIFLALFCLAQMLWACWRSSFFVPLRLSGMLLGFHHLFCNHILPFTGCPVYGRIFVLWPMLLLRLFVGMCLIISFSFVLHKEMKFDFHIIHIHHIWNWAFRSFPLLLGLSSLCLYYSTYFFFFNPECCINQTNPFGANCRSPS